MGYHKNLAHLKKKTHDVYDTKHEPIPLANKKSTKSCDFLKLQFSGILGPNGGTSLDLATEILSKENSRIIITKTLTFL